MANESEPAKLLLPYLQRADELQKHDPLVAYYCMYFITQAIIYGFQNIFFRLNPKNFLEEFKSDLVLIMRLFFSCFNF